MIILPNYRSLIAGSSITNNFYRDFKNTTVLNLSALPGTFRVYRSITSSGSCPASYFDAAGVMKYVTDITAPRFNYIFNTAVKQMTSDGLLVEQSRTNCVLPSSITTAGSKYVLGAVTATANQKDLTTSSATTGVNGILVQQTATTGTHYFQLSTPNSQIYNQQYGPVSVSGIPYSASVYVQQYQTTPYLEFFFHDGANNGVYTFLDLNQGVVTTPISIGTMSNVLSTTYVELISNVNFSKPWYRVTATGIFNNYSGNGMFMNLYPATDNVNHAPSTAGSTSNGVYAFGFQLEQCPVNVPAAPSTWVYGPSTYIPATATTFKQRGSERLYVTNGNNINWSNTTKHTWYVKVRNTYHIGKAPYQTPLLTMGQMNAGSVPSTSGNYILLSVLADSGGLTNPLYANYFNENTTLTYGWVVGTSGTSVAPSGQACFINGNTGYTGFGEYTLNNNKKQIIDDPTYGVTWPNVMFVGSQGGGSQFVHGTLQYISHYGSALNPVNVLNATGNL
jgi:uncharacterized protein YbcV (DUF1398 family)